MRECVSVLQRPATSCRRNCRRDHCCEWERGTQQRRHHVLRKSDAQKHRRRTCNAKRRRRAGLYVTGVFAPRSHDDPRCRRRRRCCHSRSSTIEHFRPRYRKRPHAFVCVCLPPHRRSEKRSLWPNCQQFLPFFSSNQPSCFVNYCDLSLCHASGKAIFFAFVVVSSVVDARTGLFCSGALWCFVRSWQNLWITADDWNKYVFFLFFVGFFCNLILLSDCFRLFSLLSRCLFSHFSSFTIARFYYRRSSLALHHSVLRRRSAIFTPSTPPVFFSPSFFLSFPFYLPSLSFRRSSVRAPKQFWRPFFLFQSRHDTRASTDNILSVEIDAQLAFTIFERRNFVGARERDARAHAWLTQPFDVVAS